MNQESNYNQIIQHNPNVTLKTGTHKFPIIKPNSPIFWMEASGQSPSTATHKYYETDEGLNEVLNRTDPYVVVEKDIKDKELYKVYDSVEPEVSTDGDSQVDTLREDGINIPIIRLNNITLKGEHINYLKIYFDDFLPKLYLVVKDKDNIIKRVDAPGWDNEIHVVITPELNGYYKKISLLFYITDINLFGEYIGYTATWKFQEFNKSKITQYPPKEDKKLSTFELLKGIAKLNGLGFAATINIPDVEDYRYRIIQGKTLQKWIPEQVEFGGFGTDNIYDCWIDLNGYIVLIDVAWVLSQNISWQDISIINMVGQHSETNSFGDDMLVPMLMPRVLTNNKINRNNYNLLIKDYENIMNNNIIYNIGSLHMNYYLRSYGNTNQLDEIDTQIIENSVEGAAYSKEYENDRYRLVGIEYTKEGDDSDIIEPIMNKIQIHQRFFTKLRSRVIKVLLDRYNLGLQRGTLIYLLIKEYNVSVARAVEPNTKPESMEESGTGTLNRFSSGLYYIDGIQFEYKEEDKKINQYLFLIKKDPLDDPVSKVNAPHVGDESNVNDEMINDNDNI